MDAPCPTSPVLLDFITLVSEIKSLTCNFLLFHAITYFSMKYTVIMVMHTRIFNSVEDKQNIGHLNICGI
jgi:hypothetical protein